MKSSFMFILIILFSNGYGQISYNSKANQNFNFKLSNSNSIAAEKIEYHIIDEALDINKSLKVRIWRSIGIISLDTLIVYRI